MSEKYINFAPEEHDHDTENGICSICGRDIDPRDKEADEAFEREYR